MTRKEATVIGRSTLVPMGFVLTLCVLVFKVSAWHDQTEFNSAAILKQDQKLDLLLERTGKTQTDVEVLKTQVEAIKKPLANTQANVKRVNARMNKLAEKVLESSKDFTQADEEAMGLIHGS